MCELRYTQRLFRKTNYCRKFELNLKSKYTDEDVDS